MSDKLIMTAEEILNNLVIDYLEYDLGINISDYEPFSDYAGTILHRIIDMDKTYETDSELSDAVPVRPVDMYERRIAVLERDNQNLKLKLEQKKEELSYCKKKVDKAKRILGRLFNDDDIDRWQKHLADETKEQCN